MYIKERKTPLVLVIFVVDIKKIQTFSALNIENWEQKSRIKLARIFSVK